MPWARVSIWAWSLAEGEIDSDAEVEVHVDGARFSLMQSITGDS